MVKKAVKTAKIKAKRATKVMAATPTWPGPEAGAPVFVRWGMGQYKLGILVRHTKDGDPIVRVARVSPKGEYTGEMGTERTFNPSEVSRVYMEKDWQSFSLRDPNVDGAGVESAEEYEARIKRGPATDSMQRPLVANQDQLMVEMVAGWKRLAEKMERERDAAEERADELEKRLSHAVAVVSNSTELPSITEINSKIWQTAPVGDQVRSGEIINVKVGRTKWEGVRVQGVDIDLVYFLASDGTIGSRRLDEEGKNWEHADPKRARRNEPPAPVKLTGSIARGQVESEQLAETVELERKTVERQTSKAVRKATGPQKSSPVSRAAATAAKMEPAVEIMHGGADPALAKVESLHARNLKEAKRRGITLHQLVEEQQRQNELDAAANGSPDMTSVIAQMRPAGTPSVPDAPRVDDEERALATRREIEAERDPWDDDVDSNAAAMANASARVAADSSDESLPWD